GCNGMFFTLAFPGDQTLNLPFYSNFKGNWDKI
ncbi:hypothetical protein LCGC14_3141870, partial [marine sediment metagenome]